MGERSLLLTSVSRYSASNDTAQSANVSSTVADTTLGTDSSAEWTTSGMADGECIYVHLLCALFVVNLSCDTV